MDQMENFSTQQEEPQLKKKKKKKASQRRTQGKEELRSPSQWRQGGEMAILITGWAGAGRAWTVVKLGGKRTHKEEPGRAIA